LEKKAFQTLFEFWFYAAERLEQADGRRKISGRRQTRLSGAKSNRQEKSDQIIFVGISSI
jgi:hypothetical protein